LVDKAGWVIRMYPANDYTKELSVVGNCGDVTRRMYDNVVAFSGMYGIDNYMIWYIHKNLGGYYDFSTMNIELKLYSGLNTKRPYWVRQYKVIDVKYDTNKSQYVLYAMSLDSAKLQTHLVDYQVKSLSYDDKRQVYSQKPSQKEMEVKRKTLTATQYKTAYSKIKRFGVLVDVLQKHNIFRVEYMDCQDESALKNFEYRMFTFDEDWRVIDFINYIADQNSLEWYVRNNVLYIGNECKAIEGMNSTRKFDLETDNISNTAWFKKYSGISRQMDVMAHIGKVWRCVWAKHVAGKSGGISKGCFTRIGIGTLSKEKYFRTLEGEPEKALGTKMLIDKPYSHYITLGNIKTDEGDPVFIDEVSVQKNKELYKINEPSDVKIDRGDDVLLLKQTKEKVVRSTPYLDDGSGILFPSPILENDVGFAVRPPNSIIFNVKGKEEASVVGPYVMGNSKEDFTIPAKERDDFRLSFPSGWTFYVDEKGRTLIQASDRSPDKTGTFSSVKDTATPEEKEQSKKDKETASIFMKPTGIDNPGALIRFMAGDGKETDTDKATGGTTVNIREDRGIEIYIKHKTNNKGVNALFEKTKILHTVLEDVTDLEWDPTIGNKTRYDQQNDYIKLEHQNVDKVDIIKVEEDLITLSTLGGIRIVADDYVQIGTTDKADILMKESDETIDIISNKDVTVQSLTANALLDGDSIKLGNAATLGVVRLGDEIKSTILEDPSYWGYWLTKWTAHLATLTAALVALTASGGTPAGVLAYAATMTTAVGLLQAGIPATLTGKTTDASTKVTSE